MKLLSFCICLLFICFFSTTLAQNYVIGDQNPRYIESQNKYLKIADSINRWHSTTSQQTYKAYDWREEREQQRRERINNRRYYRNNYWYDYNNN